MKTYKDKTQSSEINPTSNLLPNFDGQASSKNDLSNDFYNLVNSTISINRNAFYEIISVYGDWARHNFGFCNCYGNEFEMF
jgi:hypothetical protein